MYQLQEQDLQLQEEDLQLHEQDQAGRHHHGLQGAGGQEGEQQQGIYQ